MRIFPRLVLAGLLGAGLLAGRAAAEPPGRLRVCFLSLNDPAELEAFRQHLGTRRFEFVDLAAAAAHTPAIGAADPARPPWLLDACRPDAPCDMVIFTGEFAGRFFGTRGVSLSLQELEEASCNPRCDGLFHAPREVFLLGCNTLASKDADRRTPEEYLRVLLEHNFDRPAAERVVAARYGPLGPSFRESLRRIFAGVPRLYGFASVAPLAPYTAPRLERYLRALPNYHAALEDPTLEAGRNGTLLAAFAGTALIQTTGLTPAESGAAQHALICALYDERRSVAERLTIAYGLLQRPDALAFIPTLQVFLARHPPSAYGPAERSRLAEIQALEGARTALLDLLPQLEPSALKLELAHVAALVGWMPAAEFHTLAVETVGRLLRGTLTDDTIDVVCAISAQASLRDAFDADDIPAAAYRDARGLGMIACLAPRDPRVAQRVVPALRDPDLMRRMWAAHALTRLEPTDQAVLLAVVPALRDPSPEVASRIRWLLQAHPLSPAVRRAALRADPHALRRDS